MRFKRLAVWTVAVVLAGCGQSEVSFVLNREGKPTMAMRRARLEDKGPDEVRTMEGRVRNQEEALRRTLFVMFGTPDDPHAWGPSGLDEKKLRRAAGRADDRFSGLYRKHCAHCHGVSGDGAGPTARFLSPFPRDYRQGKFKFKSTAPLAAMPTREDLKRTIREGINGTAMPAFNVLLREDEVDVLTEYVIYLSLRGMVETEMAAVLDEADVTGDTDIDDAETLKGFIAGLSPDVFNRWKNAEKQVFAPPPRDEALKKYAADYATELDGRKIFLDGGFVRRGRQKEKAKKDEFISVDCKKCHGPTGLGDGPEINYDFWNEKKNEELKRRIATDDEELKRRAAADLEEMWSLPIQRIRPRNLRLGVFRGGRRPVDVYRRIAIGINGTPMPDHASAAPGDKKLEPPEIWALVDYLIYQLPYEEGGELQRQTEKAAPHKDRL